MENDIDQSSEGNKLKITKKISNIFKNVTVEPLIACSMLPSFVVSIAVQNLNLEKACRVNLNYGDEICTNIINQNTENYTAELINVQSLVANMESWKSPLLTAFPAIMISFIGAWSDRTGLRRPCMLLPIVGEFLSRVGLILCTYYFMEWSMEVTGLLEVLPQSLSGSWSTMYMAVFSYISDITTVQTRTFRTGVVTVFTNLGTPVGAILSGVIGKYLGFYGIFSFAIAFYVTGFIYGILRIKDVKRENQVRSRHSGCIEFFSPKHVVHTLMVAFKPRKGSRRVRVMLLMLIFIILTGPMHGETAVVYLFTRFKYKFTEVDYSIFVAYSVTINLIGTIIAITVFSKYLKMNDSLIGAISGLSKIAGCFIYAFAPTKAIFYFAPVVDLLSGTGIIAMRSIASKLVEPNETGKIHSLFGVCEAIVPIIYSPMYSQIYIYTIQSVPGAFYLLGGMLMIPSVLIFVAMYFLEKKEQNNEIKADLQNDLQKHAYDNEITVF